MVFKTCKPSLVLSLVCFDVSRCKHFPGLPLNVRNNTGIVKEIYWWTTRSPSAWGYNTARIGQWGWRLRSDDRRHAIGWWDSGQSQRDSDWQLCGLTASQQQQQQQHLMSDVTDFSTAKLLCRITIDTLMELISQTMITKRHLWNMKQRWLTAHTTPTNQLKFLFIQKISYALFRVYPVHITCRPGSYVGELDC